MKTIKTNYFSAFWLPAIAMLLVLGFTACNDEDIANPNAVDNEFMQTIQMKLTNIGDSTDVVIATIKRNDPEDLTPPDHSKDTLFLKANTAYRGELILTGGGTPNENISDTIRKRGTEHLVFYQPLPVNATDTSRIKIPGSATSVPLSSTLGMRVQRTDFDKGSPPLPLGLETIITTEGRSGVGNLRVLLRHQPGVKNSRYDPGSTDFDYSFTVVIKKDFITRITYSLVNAANASDKVTAYLRRPDINDNIAPDTSNAKLTLKPNTRYIGTLTLTDSTKEPDLDLTAGIRQNRNNYLFFYQALPVSDSDTGNIKIPGAGTVISASQALDMTVKITDKDSEAPPLPLGLETEIITGSRTGKGTLRILLRRQTGLKNGRFEPGITEFDYVFKVSIE
ncbi:MAG: hypothetical protein V4543_03155 [Bacteroidota bacterium]